MKNQEKEELLVKADEYIKKCNSVPFVHAYEGGALKLDSLLVDFVEYIDYGKNVDTPHLSPTG